HFLHNRMEKFWERVYQTEEAMTRYSHRLLEDISYNLRSDKNRGELSFFEKIFQSRRDRDLSVQEAIEKQTTFFRTGLLDNRRGIFARIFEPQAITRGITSILTGGAIGRQVAQDAENAK